MVGVVARGGAAHAVAESAHPDTDTQKLVAWDVSPPLAPHRARGRVQSAPVSGPRTGQGRERGIGSWQRRWRGREQVGLSETAALRQVLTWHAFGRVSAAFQRPWARAARARRTGWPCVVLYNSFSNTVLPRGRVESTASVRPRSAGAALGASAVATAVADERGQQRHAATLASSREFQK